MSDPIDRRIEVAVKSARALWLPDLVRVPDLARALELTPRAVRAAIRRGTFGPFSKVGKQIVLRRESVLRALAEREMDPSGPRTLPRGRPDLVEALRPRRGRRSRPT